MKALFSFVFVMFVVGCHHAPPTASPTAQVAYQGTQVLQALDLLRDAVITANEQVPPIVSTGTTRKVVTYHRMAITVVHEAPNGWKQTVTTALDELVASLSAEDRTFVGPYITLIKEIVSRQL
jgi:hypothetical protein